MFRKRAKRRKARTRPGELQLLEVIERESLQRRLRSMKSCNRQGTSLVSLLSTPSSATTTSEEGLRAGKKVKAPRMVQLKYCVLKWSSVGYNWKSNLRNEIRLLRYYGKQDEECSSVDNLLPSNMLLQMRWCTSVGNISKHLTFLNVPIKIPKLFQFISMSYTSDRETFISRPA